MSIFPIFVSNQILLNRIFNYSMKTKIILPFLIILTGYLSSCQQNTSTNASESSDGISVDQTNKGTSETSEAETLDDVKGKIASAAEILARPQVPILCYHQVRNWTASDGKMGKDYIVPIAEFKSQMKMLADSGYNTILPDQLYNYLAYGTKLPKKPIMLTFDDTKLDQYTAAIPEMKKYGFKGVFFIMTVSLGKPNYMSKAQVKELSDAGHVIGSHTYDHQNVKKYQGDDWVTQIEKPTKTLKEITGKDITYFAYPFGLWNKEAIPELKKRGFTSAFILAEKRDENDPLFTIRRIIASGYWSTKTLHNSIVKSF
jgi:peptidoglycan/xylan/chitin deacetylase (PgdA/CDA1 family)